MTTNPTIREYQEDGTYIDRPMTADEIAQNEKDHANWLLEQKAIEDKNAARLAVIEKLGLTPAEIDVLLG
jgi:hypothetical protein